MTSAWTELDLPRPPSVNRFMRKLGNKTPCVKAWIGEADYYLWVARKGRAIGPVSGPFEVELTFRRSDRGDLDNPIKPLLDWLQRVALVEDDKFCDRILAQWGEAPLGVRVRLRSFEPNRSTPSPRSQRPSKPHRNDDTSWVHDDALKNYEFWISWKRAQLLEQKRKDQGEPGDEC
jgi:Holliday junction resolvase RusA-like endonuclease